ncbi:hypothetical protein [Leptolyngbya ohadii]|nr:hypothetical protein [Leptolyngbya ohadii]
MKGELSRSGKSGSNEFGVQAQPGCCLDAALPPEMGKVQQLLFEVQILLR